MRTLVLADQRLGVNADGTRDGADVPARVEVTAARLEVIPLDPADDLWPDSRPRADLVDRKARAVARTSQRFADGHAASTTNR
jgi:hypothetical protein